MFKYNKILPGFRQANEEFLDLLEENYVFSFDIDNLIKDSLFDKPTLFMCGKQDNCVGYEDLWSLVNDYKKSTFSLLDVAGHNLQREQVSLLNELVNNWLLRIEKFIS